MPSIDVPAQAFNITNVAFGDLTVSAGGGSNVGNLYNGLIGYAVGPGGTPSSQRLVISIVVAPGVIRCLSAPFNGTGGVGVAFNFSAYNGGTINFEAQLAEVSSLTIGLGEIAGGDLGGTFPAPTDIAIHESGGQQLAFGSIPDASVLERSGTTVIGSTSDKTKLNNLNTMSTQAASSVAITGGTVAGLTKLGIRDTSAAYDVDIAAVSSVALTLDRTLTVDVKNASMTLQMTGNAALQGTNTGDETLATISTKTGLVKGWYDDVAGFVKSVDSTLTNLRPCDCGLWPVPSLFGAHLIAAPLDGGAITQFFDGYQALSGPVVLDIGTSHWAVAFDAVIPQPVTNRYGWLSMHFDDTHLVSIGHAYDWSVAAQTHLNTWTVNGSGGGNATNQYNILADGLRHTFIILFNGTNVKFYVDGVLKDTITTNLPTGGAGSVAIYSRGTFNDNRLPLSRFAVVTVL
jgi:hypothetical protein